MKMKKEKTVNENEYKLDIPEDFNVLWDYIKCPKCKKKTMRHWLHNFHKQWHQVVDEKGNKAIWYCQNPKCNLKLWRN